MENLARRYDYIRSLGEGAQGVVHLAKDRFLGDRLVAVKTLRPQANEEWLSAFRHEFEVLSGLSHPRLSQVHDFGATGDGKIFFTRDYVAGDDLKAATIRIGARELLALFIEICRALKPLHSRGLLHGDLKPGNIICSPDGIAHLIDFSFVRASGDDAMRRGTVQYMAPEVIEGRSVDGRADLYSLGATIFDIASGMPPFEGTVAEVVAGHLGERRPVLEPERLVAKSAESKKAAVGIKTITERLLARDPDHRFPDIWEVEAALTALLSDSCPPDPLPDYPVVSESAGRDRELTRIRQAVEKRLMGPSDESSLKVIEGALGTGKTSILCSIKWWAQLSGVAVLETRCSGSLLGSVAELIDQALEFLSGDDTARALGEHLVEQLLRPGAAGTDLNGLTQESARLLLKVAAKHKLLIEVSDVQQASPETLSVLRGLTAAIGSGDPVVILAACEPQFTWKERLGWGESVTLPLLDAEEIGQLVLSLLGRSEPEAAKRIKAHTGGNPLFVMTLLKDLAASGEALERLETLGPPRQLEIYWRDKLETLAEDKRRIVEAAAVLDRPAKDEELAGVGGVESDGCAALLPALENGGWLRRGAAGWHMATAVLAKEVRAATGAQKLAEYHGRALELEPDEAKKLLHAARSGNLSQIRSKGQEVAESLERMGALSAARELLEEMIRVLAGEPEEQSVRLILGRICLAEGDFTAVEAHLKPLLESKDPETKRQTLLLLGRIDSYRGELENAAKRLREVLAISGSAVDDARALRELANVEYKRSDFAKCASSAEKGLDLVPSGHPVRSDLLTVLAKAASAEGNSDQALAYAQEAASQARRGGDRRSLAFAIVNIAWVRQNSGDLKGAVEDLERAVSLNREFGDFPRLMRDLRVLGDLKWWLEDWGSALTHYEEAARLAGSLASPKHRLESSTALGMALAKAGRFERAQLVLSESEKEATEIGLEELRLLAREYLADLLAAQGKFEEAKGHFNEAREGLPSYLAADIDLEMAGWHLWRANPGDVVAAKELIESAEKRKREYEGRGFSERLQLQRGCLTIAEGSFEEGVRILDGLAERVQESGMKDLAWQAHLAAARGYLSRGSEFLARRKLKKAEEILDGLAAGFPPEMRAAFWQDIRRAEVRHLLAAVPSSSSFSSSLLIEKGVAQLDQEAHALYRILEFNKLLSAEHDLSRLLEAILDAAIELTGAERGLVLMVVLESESHGLEIRAARGIGTEDETDPHERFSRSIAESVHLDGEPVITIDAMGDERFNEFISVHELKLKSVACIPVRYRGQALGVLYLENRLRRGRFSGKDLRVLAAFADQVAIAISQARLIEEAGRRQSELQEARQAIEEAYEKQSQYLNSKKVDLEITRDRLQRLRKQLEGEGDYFGVVGSGPRMSKVFSLIDRVKELDVPVVIVGESGTGKDLLARVIHERGGRKEGPFVALNCGSVPETLVEATLFGHVKGAFSGAASDKHGILDAACGGTLYLDEIGDMSPRMQVDLLRVLQEGVYTPLGSSQTIDADFRLVASSKVPLTDLVEAGRLRQDLFYRLQVVTVEIPPLRKRTEDILALARRFIDREAIQVGSASRVLSKEAADALLEHKWPGNVRELEQAIRRVVLIGDGAGQIMPEELFAHEKKRQRGVARDGGSKPASGSPDDSDILAVLERCQWNRTKAAEELGIPRRTFYRKLQKMGLSKKQG